MRSTSAELLRFVGAGAVGTVLTYLLYLALVAFLAYPVAYTLSYAAGIFVSYALNTWFVFRQPWSWTGLAQYPLVYVVQYGFGVACLALLVERFDVEARIAPLAVIVLSLPLTFLLTRLVIRRRAQ